MALFCYVTKQIVNDVTTHGVAKSRLDEFAKEIEKRQSVAGFDHFPPPCLTKKKIFGFHYRLIAAEKHFGDHLVVVLLRLVVRGDHEYSAFLDDPSTWAQRHYHDELDDAELEDWVIERSKVEPPPPPPALSDTEQTFLWSSTYSEQNDDIIICAPHEWVNRVKEPRITDRLIRLPELILQAIGRPAGEVQILHSASDQLLVVEAFNVQGTRQCVLLSVSYSETDDQLWSQEMMWLERLRTADAETVLRYSRRSYPSYLCVEDDMWMAVEKDARANLALSPEEAEILRASNLQDPARSAFPLFINGRAGSGKSTLLQYLFARCLHRWASQPSWESVVGSRPLYIASSRELLKVAKDVVRSLLKANHEYLLTNQCVDPTHLDSLDGCFQDFLHFMRTALGEDSESRYPSAAYVSYAKFRRLWMERFGKEKKAVHEYGPQISWHVIRGFIKGMSVDELLAKGDYDELPEDERTISRQVYEAVYDRVWAAWYEPLCRNGDVWDSQDLVRCLLEENRLPASHVAVFCDEAQDFTRLELEALYRCSLFSQRQIDNLSVKRVPFVFAGDPFQTLNPTGFRWESVRAAFTERILRSLYRFNARTEVPQLNYRELTFNYRSSTRIVHLCNSIQAVRASLFGHPSLSPQNTWQLGDESSSPVFFEKGDTQMEMALREQSDLVLIVPCEEGEEVEYVADEPYLSSFVQFDDDGTPRNILSAARAKGLEFLRVALYGWSSREEAMILAKMMRSPADCMVSVDKRLCLEYFMNNLYVAASRAQRRLFVIDEKKSRDELWWFATDEQHLLKIIEELPQRDLWSRHTGLLVRGVPESFRDDRDDPKAIAERFEREGRSSEDSYLLKQASQQYAIAGEMMKAYECRAVAAILDGRYLDAGENYKRAGQVENSIDAYWRGRFYKEIDECAKANPDFARYARSRVAAFISGESHTVRECRSVCAQVLENAKINEELRTDLRSALWKDALHQAVQKVEGKDKAKAVLNPEDAGALAELLEQVRKFSAQVDTKQIARLFFAAGRYQEVLKLLPSDDVSEIYRDASALALIEQASSTERHYSTVESRIIAEYYYRQKEYEKAARFYGDIHDSGRLLECLLQGLQGKKPREADAILESTLIALVANAEWVSLISLLTSGHPRLAKQDKWGKAVCAAVLDRVVNKKMIVRLVVPALAHSVELSNADGRSQQQVSEFLANHLIKTGYPAWRNDLSREVAGAAIERAGRDIDALQFYESWRDFPGPSGSREYAERRWVVCKRRQASRQEREGYDKKASSYRQDAAKVMERYGWTEDAVADTFPELPAGSFDTTLSLRANKKSQPESVSSTAKTSRDAKSTGDERGQVGPLRYSVIASKAWINIEAEDGLCARVLVHERRVTSNDVSVKSLEGGHVECEGWGLQIWWLTDGVVEFRLGQMVCKVSVGEHPSDNH